MPKVILEQLEEGVVLVDGGCIIIELEQRGYVVKITRSSTTGAGQSMGEATAGLSATEGGSVAVVDRHSITVSATADLL